MVAMARSVSQRAVLDDHDGRVGIGAGGQQVAAQQRRVADAHVDRERGALGGERLPVEIGLALGGGAGDDRELAHALAQRHGQADARGAGMRGRDARHHLDVDAGRLAARPSPRRRGRR